MKGNLSVGGEYSYNHRTDAYTFQASDYVPVKATDTEINEKSAAAFVEYGRQFGKVFAQAGLRYEHLTMSLSARPTIGRWHPIWYAFTVFQNYTEGKNVKEWSHGHSCDHVTAEGDGIE